MPSPRGIIRLCEMTTGFLSVASALPYATSPAKRAGKVNEVMSIYQTAVRGELDTGDQLRNILHYEFPSYIPTAAELQELVDELLTSYENRLQSLLPTEITIVGVDVRRVDIGDQPTAFIVPTGGAWAGTNTNNLMPSTTAVLVTAKAPTTFPRTARTYLFPMTSEALATDGRVTAATLANALSWGSETLAIAITGQPDAQRVTVRYSGDPRVVTASNTLTTVRVASRWATMRSRRLGVGA